jgi:NADH:ubiquinone oxidoreductase subunit E
MKFTLSAVACMGACSQAPVIRIGDKTYGGLTPDKTRQLIRVLMHEVGAKKD